MATYTVAKMRVSFPKGKMKELHPDRFVTVYGTFFNAEGTAYSFNTKVITRDEAKSDGFVLDIDKGILTLPDGQRGRRESVSISQADLLAELETLRSED